MSARIIDGKAIAAELRAKIAGEVARLQAAHQLVPGIAVVQVGDNPASSVYVRNKAKAVAEAATYEPGQSREPFRRLERLFTISTAVHATIHRQIFASSTWTRTRST